MVNPSARLLQSFIALPAPTAPTRRTFSAEPKACSSGRAASQSASAAPPSTPSVPSRAGATDPATGAST